jgi:hypothetical protein
MISSVAAAIFILQMAPSLQQTIEPVQYRVRAHPPPCGDGFDLSARDGLCYPNGFLRPQDQAARQYQG